MINSKGFTLIEVILALVILAVAIPGMISAVSFMNTRQVSTIGGTTAAALAQERMEQIVGDRINPLRGYGYVIGANYPAEAPMGAPFGNYTRTVNIICVNAADLNTSVACTTDYKRVQVTVSASGLGPSVPNAVLYTVVANH